MLASRDGGLCEKPHGAGSSSPKTPMEKDLQNAVEVKRHTATRSRCTVLCQICADVQQIHARQNHAFFLGGASCFVGISPLGPFFFLGLHSPGSEGLKGNLTGETAVWQTTMDMTTWGSCGHIAWAAQKTSHTATSAWHGSGSARC